MEVMTYDVINSIFRQTETVCLRVFDDKKRGMFKGQKLSVEAGKFATIETTLRNHNAEGRGVFFVVNSGGQSDEDINRINAQFVESDKLSFEEMQARIDSFPLQPSMIVKTRKSLHAYWFVKDAEVARFRPIQKSLVTCFDGDPACINESRVMRLPGFFHCKEEPLLVECVSFHPERRYTQGELEAALPQVEIAPIAKVDGTEKGIDVVVQSCDFIRHCRDNAAALSEPEWYAMITILANFVGGTEQIHALSASYPNYTEAETDRKIKHFIESGTKPMTCKTICEKGFKCPKFAVGGCSVKSPAALCFKPLNNTVLKEIVAELPVSTDAVENITIARDFVEKYLCNQDAAVAEMVIRYQLKEKFHFLASDLKPLFTIYKECAKAHRTEVNARRSKVEPDEIPSWYTLTENGLKFRPGLLAEYLAKNEKVIYAAEQYYIYESGVYREMKKIEAERMVQKQMITNETKMSQIMDAEHQWRLQAQIDLKELNPNPYIINVRNGLYNVLEDKLEDHTSDYRSTVQLNVNYDKNATCPLFREFLDEAMEGDDEQVRLIQEMIGYFLIPVTVAQKCFVIVGEANAGKSILLRVLNEILLGRRNVSNVTWQSLNERFKTAELFGKLANIFSDLPTKNIDDNGVFKALVGEDHLTVERKNKDPFSFQSTARLLFSCNSIPKNYGDKSEGFYRRLIIIRFNHAVPLEQRDPHLIEKFQNEADGIFLFALDGLKRLMNNNYTFSETDKNYEELRKYREDNDSVLAFVRESCELSKDGEVGSTELYNVYKGYCEECNLKPYSHRKFVQQLTTLPNVTSGVDKTGRRRTLKGIHLGEVLG